MISQVFQLINEHNCAMLGEMCELTLLHDWLKLKTINKVIKFWDKLNVVSKKNKHHIFMRLYVLMAACYEIYVWKRELRRERAESFVKRDILHTYIHKNLFHSRSALRWKARQPVRFDLSKMVIKINHLELKLRSLASRAAFVRLKTRKLWHIAKLSKQRKEKVAGNSYFWKGFFFAQPSERRKREELQERIVEPF